MKINEKPQSEQDGKRITAVAASNGFILESDKRREVYSTFSEMVQSLYEWFGMHDNFKDKVILSLRKGGDS